MISTHTAQHSAIPIVVFTVCLFVFAPLVAAVFPSAETDVNGNTIYTNSSGEVAYRFIVSGYPVVNSCSFLETEAVSLESATRTRHTDASSLEARYRTLKDSDGVALRSDKFRFFGIVFR